MNPFWSKKVQQLTPYVPGEQPKLGHQLIKLNTNENPYPPSPKVREALQDIVNSDLQLYPDPSGEKLKLAIANYYQLNVEQVFVGNGSDEVLALAFMALLKHEKPILFPDISYSFYPVYCKLFEIEYLQVPLAEDFSINVNDYLKENGGIIFPNPNAPTGCLLALEQITELLKHNPNSLVVVDEAYIDFGGESAVSLINQYPNLLVVQTFSKSRSLAGLRVGFAMGNKELIEALERVKNSFNSYPLDQFALHGAVAAINDQAYFLQQCQQIISSRKYLNEQLLQLGFKVLDSAANFIFVSHQSLAAENISQHLRQNYIIVRHFKQARIDNYLRITIGTQQQCEELVKELSSILQKHI